MLSLFRKNALILGSFMFAILMLVTCKKEEPTTFDGAPISIMEPVENPYTSTAGKTVPYSFKVTTDQNIDSITVRYHIDSTQSGFDDAVDPTLYWETFKPTTLMNIMDCSGNFTIPSNLKYGTSVRLLIQFRAKDRSAKKQLRIDIK